MSQVVNSRRGMHTAGGRSLTRESTTRRGLARPGRLMPEEIYRIAGSREEAISLLRQHGYLRAPLRPAGPASPAVPELSPAVQLPSAVPLTEGQELARRVVKPSAAGFRDEIVPELERQAGLTPLAAQRLEGVELGGPHFAPGEPLAGANAYYHFRSRTVHLSHEWQGIPGFSPDVMARIKQRSISTGWSSPTGAPTMLRSVLAHEYGHHVHETMKDLGWQSMRRFASTVGDELNIRVDVERIGSFDSMIAQIEAGVLRDQERVGRLVSEYGASSPRELLAEIWQEHSTLGAQARPHIRAIGSLMQELAELAVRESA